MEEYPKSVSKQCHIKILEQINNSVFEIKFKDRKKFIGLFCHIKYKNKIIPIIIINDYIKDQDLNTINILINNKLKTIELIEIIYKNKYYNISIIKIKAINEYNNIKFVELDDRIYVNEDEIYNNKDSIYIIQYNNVNNVSISYGVIKEINNEQIIYTGNINSISKFSPIFNLSNNKLIGIHKNKSKYYNKGIYFKSIINKNIYYNSEVEILIKIERNDINKEIYFLDNYEYKDNEGITHYHDNLKEINKLNTELYINDKKYKYKKYFKFEKEGINKINLLFDINLKDCSYMFAGCDKITSINFINFNCNNLLNMEYMFYKCKNLKKLNLFALDTKNVRNMSYMFYYCENLNNLDLSSFIIKNVSNKGNIIDFISLKNIPDISLWQYIIYNNESKINDNLIQIIKDIFNNKNEENIDNIFNFRIENIYYNSYILLHLNKTITEFNKFDEHFINDIFLKSKIWQKIQDIKILTFNKAFLEDIYEKNMFFNYLLSIFKIISLKTNDKNSLDFILKKIFDIYYQIIFDCIYVNLKYLSSIEIFKIDSIENLYLLNVDAIKEIIMKNQFIYQNFLKILMDKDNKENDVKNQFGFLMGY